MGRITHIPPKPSPAKRIPSAANKPPAAQVKNNGGGVFPYGWFLFACAAVTLIIHILKHAH